MFKPRTKLIWTTALGLSLGMVAGTARAQSPAPTFPAWQPTRTIAVADAPQVPAKAPPADLPPGKMPSTGQTPTPPTTPTTPTPESLTTPPTTDTSADAGLGAGGVATASSLGMQGRADANNRFNIFDNMAALPSNHIWGGFEYQNAFKTGAGAGTTDSTLLPNRQVTLYREGVEIAIGSRFSIAAQDEYIHSAGSPDSWGNPQFLAKYVVYNDECSQRVISVTLGFQPQVSTSPNELHERTTRFYPGILFFQGLGDNLFAQGGAQFGYSTNDVSQTADYALSFGYWIYRDPRLDVAGRRIDNGSTASGCCNDCCERRWISGLIPQVEILGKNVLANSKGQALEVSDTTNFGEGRNVYDVTVGGRVLFTPHVSLSSGFSFPITGADVRSAEFISYLNVSF